MGTSLSLRNKLTSLIIGGPTLQLIGLEMTCCKHSGAKYHSTPSGVQQKLCLNGSELFWQQKQDQHNGSHNVMPDHCIIQYIVQLHKQLHVVKSQTHLRLVARAEIQKTKTVNTASLSIHPYDHNSIISSVCTEPTVQSTHCTQVCCLFP